MVDFESPSQRWGNEDTTLLASRAKVNLLILEYWHISIYWYTGILIYWYILVYWDIGILMGFGVGWGGVGWGYIDILVY